MTDITKTKMYLTYLDRILAGEKNIGPVEDDEVAKLLRLTQSMIAADFSRNSEIRESLRKQLLDRLSSADKSILAVMVKDSGQEEGELTEEELNYAAAGLAGQGGENKCPRCGARLSGFPGKCPFCR